MLPLAKISFSSFLLFACSVGCVAQQEPMLMRLVADGNQMQNETVVYFDSLATSGYDPLYDAPSLGVDPGALNIVTRLNNTDYQINALPTLTQNITVPVKITTGVTGLYSVYAEDIDNLPEGASITLHDLHLNTTQDLRIGPMQYLIQDTETVARFQLIISVNILHNVSGSVVDPMCSTSADGHIVASATGSGPFNYYWKDSLNNIIQVSLNKTGADTLHGVNEANYRVDVTTPGTNNNATVYFHPVGSSRAIAGFTPNNSQVNINNGYASVHFNNLSVNGQFYTWDFGDGTGSNFVNPNHNYTQTGTYTVTLTSSNSACPDVSIHKEVITVNGTTGISPHSSDVRLERDVAGQFVSGLCAGATLTVSDLLGRNLITETASNGATKIYLPESLPTNEVLLLQVSSNQGSIAIKFIR